MATTEQVGSSVEQIPYVALEELGKIFFEGQSKYGVGNWKDNPSPSYRLERLRHAIRHLFLFAEHDTSEKHLAKVLWFCVTELFLESKYGPLRSFSSRELYPDAKHKEPIGVSIETGQVLFDTDLNKMFGKNVAKTGTNKEWEKAVTKTAIPTPKQYEFTNANIQDSKPTVTFETYQMLQVEFETFKVRANQEIEHHVKNFNNMFVQYDTLLKRSEYETSMRQEEIKRLRDRINSLEDLIKKPSPKSNPYTTMIPPPYCND